MFFRLIYRKNCIACKRNDLVRNLRCDYKKNKFNSLVIIFLLSNMVYKEEWARGHSEPTCGKLVLKTKKN